MNLDSVGLIASMMCATVLVSNQRVWIERNVLVCLLPHLLRLSATLQATVKAAVAADRMAMDGISQL